MRLTTLVVKQGCWRKALNTWTNKIPYSCTNHNIFATYGSKTGANNWYLICSFIPGLIDIKHTTHTTACFPCHTSTIYQFLLSRHLHSFPCKETCLGRHSIRGYSRIESLVGTSGPANARPGKPGSVGRKTARPSPFPATSSAFFGLRSPWDSLRANRENGFNLNTTTIAQPSYFFPIPCFRLVQYCLRNWDPL